MDVRVPFAIAHCANLIMDSIGIVMIFHMLADKSINDFLLLFNGKLVGQ